MQLIYKYATQKYKYAGVHTEKMVMIYSIHYTETNTSQTMHLKKTLRNNNTL